MQQRSKTLQEREWDGDIKECIDCKLIKCKLKEFRGWLDRYEDIHRASNGFSLVVLNKLDELEL